MPMSVAIHSLSALAAFDREGAAAGEVAEREAFARALRPLEQGLIHLIWRLLGWPSQAADIEDVLQDVLLCAWSKRVHLREAGAFAGWLRRIAVNKARNHARGALRRSRRIALAGFAPGDEPVGLGPDPVDAALREALLALRHQDREVLVLHYLEGHAPAEIAVLLGVRRNAIEARLSRARRRLRERLGEDDDG
ncbi:MAG: RNA polymerase sigma factor [Planctomycetes bacterium]|nr:RNA polymerase sigma factor [Planctomycetota bacterium]